MIEQELVDTLRDELEQLWGDLSWARRETVPRGSWSLRCQNLADRIVAISEVVGPTPWDKVDVTLLRGGTYERVHRDADIEYLPINWDRVAEVERAIATGASAPRRRISDQGS